MHSVALRLAVIASCAAGAVLATAAVRADVVTGTVTPGNASVQIINTRDNQPVATLGAGRFQLQLPVGRYVAKCLAPRPREQEFLSLSQPVTVNIDCG